MGTELSNDSVPWRTTLINDSSILTFLRFCVFIKFSPHAAARRTRSFNDWSGEFLLPYYSFLDSHRSVRISAVMGIPGCCRSCDLLSCRVADFPAVWLIKLRTGWISEWRTGSFPERGGWASVQRYGAVQLVFCLLALMWLVACFIIAGNSQHTISLRGGLLFASALNSSVLSVYQKAISTHCQITHLAPQPLPEQINVQLQSRSASIQWDVFFRALTTFLDIS